MNLFEGKVAVITGSNKGIGQTTAYMLADKGCKVVITGRDTEKIEETVRMVRSKGGESIGVTADITEPEQCERLFKETVQAFGKVDFLINNAGMVAKGLMEESVPSAYKTVFDLNVLGSIYPTHIFLPEIKRNKGSIIFVSSVAGVVGLPSYTAYCGSKRAVVAIAETLKLELAGTGVFVGINYPYFTETEKNKEILQGDGSWKQKTPREGVKVVSREKSAASIVRQLQNRKFRVFGYFVGNLTQLVSRLFPRLTMLVLKLNRSKIMAQQ